MRFRRTKLASEIDAEQFNEGQPIPKGVCFGWRCGGDSRIPHLHTMHEGQRVNVTFGDWIVPEPDGEHYYPIKPSAMALNYEPID